MQMQVYLLGCLTMHESALWRSHSRCLHWQQQQGLRMLQGGPVGWLRRLLMAFLLLLGIFPFSSRRYFYRRDSLPGLACAPLMDAVGQWHVFAMCLVLRNYCTMTLTFRVENLNQGNLKGV